MTTLAIMKARIATEIRRPTGMTAQIADAITSAIAAYQGERTFFNAKRTVTFPTVATQEFYTSADNANIPLIEKIDYVKLYQSSSPYSLDPEDPSLIESLSQSATQTGFPLVYCHYDGSIRLWPVPDAVYTIRIGGVYQIAAPAFDAETGNPWMTEAERLIRSRAKYELATHVLFDGELAGTMASAVTEAFAQLKRRTNQKVQSGGWEVTPTEF